MTEETSRKSNRYGHLDAVKEAHDLYTVDIEFQITPLALKMLRDLLTSVDASEIVELAFDKDFFDRPPYEFVRTKRIERNLENLAMRSVLRKKDGLYSFDYGFLDAFVTLESALLNKRQNGASNDGEIKQAISNINDLIRRGKIVDDRSNVIPINRHLLIT